MMSTGIIAGMDGKIHTSAGIDAESGERRRRERSRTKGRLQSPHSKTKAAAGTLDEYTVFSLWDTFRAAHPLYTIIDQKRTVDFINTFIRQYEQGGRLPVWELAGNETDTMIGYHAVSVIADAMAKGITGLRLRKSVRRRQTLRRTRPLRPRRLQKTRLHLDGGRERIGLKNPRIRV